MQDTFLIYLMLANMRHAGYFAVLTGPLHRAKVAYLLLRTPIARNVHRAAAALAAALSWTLRACGIGIRSGGHASVTFRSSGTLILMTQSQWMESLARLENYVSSIV
jgi:hypothetical protein